MLYRCVSRAAMYVSMRWGVAWSQVWRNLLGSIVGESASMMDVCWYSVRVSEFRVSWWLCSSNLERVVMRSLAICLVLGHWSRICISVPVCLCVCVCCFVLLTQYWGIVVVSGFPRVNKPQTTWGGRILTLHLNYVAGDTGPLLFCGCSMDTICGCVWLPGVCLFVWVSKTHPITRLSG